MFAVSHSAAPESLLLVGFGCATGRFECETLHMEMR
jgi:hypothetical protein